MIHAELYDPSSSDTEPLPTEQDKAKEKEEGKKKKMKKKRKREEEEGKKKKMKKKRKREEEEGKKKKMKKKRKREEEKKACPKADAFIQLFVDDGYLGYWRGRRRKPVFKYSPHRTLSGMPRIAQYSVEGFVWKCLLPQEALFQYDPTSADFQLVVGLRTALRRNPTAVDSSNPDHKAVELDPHIRRVTQEAARALEGMGLGDDIQHVVSTLRVDVHDVMELMLRYRQLTMEYIADAREWPVRSTKQQAAFDIPVADPFYLAMQLAQTIITRMRGVQSQKLLVCMLEINMLLPKEYAKQGHTVDTHVVFGHLCIVIFDLRLNKAFLFDPIAKKNLGALQRSIMQKVIARFTQFAERCGLSFGGVVNGPQPGNVKKCRQCDAYCLLFVHLYALGWTLDEIQLFWNFGEWSRKHKIVAYENMIMDRYYAHREPKKPRLAVAFARRHAEMKARDIKKQGQIHMDDTLAEAEEEERFRIALALSLSACAKKHNSR